MATLENVVRWTSSGLDAVHVAQRSSAGWISGYAGLTTSNTNQGSGMRRIEGAELFGYALQEPNALPILGDNAVYDTFMYPSADALRVFFEAGGSDLTFMQDTDGLTSYAEGIYNIAPHGSALTNPRSFVFLLTYLAHGKDANNIDQPGFETEIIISTRVTALGRDERRHQQNAKTRYGVTINNAAKLPWGKTTSATFGTTYVKSISLVTQYRMMLHTWIADGTATTTTALDYTPAVSTAADFKAWNANTGAALTISSVNTSAKTVTLASAPASGVPVVILYPVQSF
jgi:hypothetical protein